MLQLPPIHPRTALACLLAGAIACSESEEPDSLTLLSLQGSYSATHLIYRAVLDSARHVDLVTEFGHRIHLQVQDSLYRWTDSVSAIPIGEVAVDSGSLVVTGDSLFLLSDGLFTISYHAILVGTELRLTDSLETLVLCPGECHEPTYVLATLLRE
jgi:hypothetical protein